MKTRLFLIILTLAGASFLFTGCNKEEEIASPQTTEFTISESADDDLSGQAYTDYLTELQTQVRSNRSMTDDISLTLDNGNELFFIPVEGDNALVVESHECEDCSALDALEAVSEAGEAPNPLDIYWAYSRPGDLIPAELTYRYQKSGNSLLSAQGWARDKIEMPRDSDVGFRAAQIACDDVSFISSIAGGFIGNPDFIRLNKKPANYNAFKKVNSSTCFHIACLTDGSVSLNTDDYTTWVCRQDTRYRYRATFSGIQNWRGKICGRAIENSNHSHKRRITSECSGSSIQYMGPIVSFQIRVYDQIAGAYFWRNIKSGKKVATYELPANNTRSYSWRAYWSTPTSFRLAVDDAKRLDQFDFMMDK